MNIVIKSVCIIREIYINNLFWNNIFLNSFVKFFSKHDFQTNFWNIFRIGYVFINLSISDLLATWCSCEVWIFPSEILYKSINIEYPWLELPNKISVKLLFMTTESILNYLKYFKRNMFIKFTALDAKRLFKHLYFFNILISCWPC